MRKVLLTGASGFIGRHCLSGLSSQFDEVHAISRDSSAQEATGTSNNVKWHGADLRNDRMCRELIEQIRPSHLLHVAWCSESANRITSTENFEWLSAGRELFRYFGESGGMRAVGVGSCAEYDWQDGICHELTTPTDGQSVYGRCKNALREELESLSESCNLSAAWARVFFAYGPFENERRLVPSICTSLIRGIEARCTHGEQRRDYLHVQDIADALVLLLVGDLQGSINIGSGAPVRLREIAELLAEKSGRLDLLRLGALEASPDEAPLVVSDSTRLRKELGFHPAISIDQGLQSTLDWWRLHLASSAP